jgi:hypothetical protein
MVDPLLAGCVHHTSARPLAGEATTDPGASGVVAGVTALLCCEVWELPTVLVAVTVKV